MLLKIVYGIAVILGLLDTSVPTLLLLLILAVVFRAGERQFH